MKYFEKPIGCGDVPPFCLDERPVSRAEFGVFAADPNVAAEWKILRASCVPRASQSQSEEDTPMSCADGWSAREYCKWVGKRLCMVVDTTLTTSPLRSTSELSCPFSYPVDWIYTPPLKALLKESCFGTGTGSYFEKSNECENTQNAPTTFPSRTASQCANEVVGLAYTLRYGTFTVYPPNSLSSDCGNNLGGESQGELIQCCADPV